MRPPDTGLVFSISSELAHQAAGTLTIGQHIELKYKH